jgi:serine/threonine protein kinase
LLSRRSGWAIAHAIATSPASSTYMSVMCPDWFFDWGDGSMLLHTVIVAPGCSGQTLSHKLKANIVRDMLCGLQHMHSQDIVHSSLRPSALVVHFDSEQVPTHTQILDLSGTAVLQAVSTAVEGPLAYMPPDRRNCWVSTNRARQVMSGRQGWLRPLFSSTSTRFQSQTSPWLSSA